MKYLGLDYGTKRIGVAVSDGEGRVAFPLTVVPAGRGALAEIDALIKKEGAQKIVIGESRDFSGKANPVQEDIAQFKADLEELSGLPVVFQQEFFTSALAARQFAPAEKSRKKNPDHTDLDASAAALLLQSFLDTLNRDGN
ncbi:MAG: Holliday junction resolvase RuvX [Patescibacteria group bacterium]|nr:Holliday junction resolvase RuvX [Patescibacteria group bacterium]